MIEKYYEALQKRENLRENLVGLRAQIKDEAAKEQFVSMIGDGGLLLELLEEEDPKVRKNVAMILGELEWMGAADALVTAYEREQTLFVKSTYLKALAYLDIRNGSKREWKNFFLIPRQQKKKSILMRKSAHLADCWKRQKKAQATLLRDLKTRMRCCC